MTKWGDNALYRGMLAGFLTLLLGSCIGSPLAVHFFKVPAPCLMVPVGIWIAAIGVGVAAARWSRRKDQPERWGVEGKCESCGYDLTGNTSGKCPECGTHIGAAAERQPPAK